MPMSASLSGPKFIVLFAFSFASLLARPNILIWISDDHSGLYTSRALSEYYGTSSNAWLATTAFDLVSYGGDLLPERLCGVS